MAKDEILLDGDAIDRTLRRMAASMAEQALSHDAQDLPLAIVGIRRGGVPLAEHLAAMIHANEGLEIPVGTIDISLYRDDAATALPDPKIGPSRIDFDIKGRDVVLVDDVLQTGRTVRAAIDCLLDYGRPTRVWLAVLLDRGGRELPVQPDFVGKAVDIAPHRSIVVDFNEEGLAQSARLIAEEKPA